jgi:hypothetical protein
MFYHVSSPPGQVTSLVFSSPELKDAENDPKKDIFNHTHIPNFLRYSKEAVFRL